MPPHPLTNFKIKKYENEPRFNGVYSRDNLPKTIKNRAYVINLDEYEDVGTHWIALQPLKLGKMAGGKRLLSYMYYLTAVRRQKFQRVFFVLSIIKSDKQMLKCFLQMILLLSLTNE